MAKTKEPISSPPPPPPSPDPCGCSESEENSMFVNIHHRHVPSYVLPDAIRPGPAHVLPAGSEIWVMAADVPSDCWKFLLIYDYRTDGFPRVLAMTAVDLSESRISAYTCRKAPSAKVRAILLPSEAVFWGWARSQAFVGLVRGNNGAGGSTVLGDGNGVAPVAMTLP